MKQYYVEGLYVRGSKKGARGRADEVEPFARAFLAASPEEAIRLATEALQGGHWVQGPKLSMTTEEQRMRQMGAPRLPGFGVEEKSKKK
jgi:hypothetical protein